MTKFNSLFPSFKNRNFAWGPMIAGDHLAHVLGKPIDQVVTDGHLIAKGVLKVRELYDSDFAIIFADIAVEAEALGVTLDYFPGKNPQIVKHLPPENLRVMNPCGSGRIPEMFKAAQLCRNHPGDNVPIFFSMKDPFSLAALVTGTEYILTNLIDNPDKVRDVIGKCLDTQMFLIDQICTSGFIPLVGAPISSGSLIGAKWFQEFALKPIQTLFERVAAMGTLRCMHICGEITPVQDQLIELNPDVLSFEEWNPTIWEGLPDTIPMGYISTDLFSYRVKFENQEDRKLVSQKVSECLENLPRPCIISTGCDLPGNSDPDMVQFVKRCVFKDSSV